MTAAGRKAPGRAQNLIRILASFQVCIFDGVAVKSAFALLSTKVTKPERGTSSMPISGANMTDKRKGKIAYGENDKCNDRKRFCEP